MARIIWSREQPVRDRYVRRTCDDYFQAFLALLPVGQAWPREPGGTLWRACRGLACYWGWIDGRAGDLLERESDPRKTIELLPDWERAWGLPDPCFPDAMTIAERQRMLVLKMTWQGGQSREYFEKVMEWLGFTIHIREFSPFMAGISEVGDTRARARQRYEWVPDRMEGGIFVDRPVPSGWVPLPGDELPDDVPDDNYRWYIGPPEMRFAWAANVSRMGLVWFRAASGQAGVDPHLQFRMPEDLQCLLNRWKPAHTMLVMNVAHNAFTEPMDGTEMPLSDQVIRWRFVNGVHERYVA